MKKTAQQPAGEATNQQPTPISDDRRESSYHKKQKRVWIDKIVFVVVGFLAVIIISLSFGNTGTLAETLELNPWLAAGMVEVLFGSLLVIRGRQRALQRNVPLFLDAGYFSSLAFVTAVNMWGLGQIHPVGFVVGAAITGAMWLMENTLVWLSTDSHKPHKKSLRELEKEAEREIKKIKSLQRIEWKRWEAEKPDLDLIKEARKAERKRKEVVGDGLPEFWQTEVTGELEATEEPEATREPRVTEEPEATREPRVTEEPEATREPRVTEEPEATREPRVTEEPEATREPRVTEEPEATREPRVAAVPAVQLELGL